MTGKILEHSLRRGSALCLGVTCCVLLAVSGPALARGNAEAEELEVMELGGTDLMTFDGVGLSATFYPGKGDKETVPVLLLHEYKGSRKDFAILAPALAEKGYAVLAPDLRGHGDSTSKMVIRGGRRQVVKLDSAKMRASDFALMAKHDMGAFRRFLIGRNNQGQLNFNKLVIVGLELGAAIAVDWAAYDWSLPNYPGLKQSQDAKALVLVSPEWSYAGLHPSKSLNHAAISSLLPIMILVGKEDSRTASDAKRIHDKLQVVRREDFSGLSAAEAAEKMTLWYLPLPTKLQGAKLLNAKPFNTEPLKLPDYVSKFIDIRVARDTSAATAWIEHATPK